MAAIVQKFTPKSTSSTILPILNPVVEPENVIRGPFEGVEKRLIIQFEPSFLAASGSLSHGNLRSLPHEAWSELLRYAACQILNQVEVNPRSAEASSGCTAYLLSESSLFVFESKIILKTCGTTTPLLLVPVLIHLLSSSKPSPFTPFESLFASKEPMSSLSTTSSERGHCYGSFEDWSTRPPASDSSVCSSGEISPQKIVSLQSLSLASSPVTTMDSDGSDASEGDLEGLRIGCTFRAATACHAVSYFLFTHMNYCFPELQKAPHRSFKEEISYLDCIFCEESSFLNQKAESFALQLSPEREFFCYAWTRPQEKKSSFEQQEGLTIALPLEKSSECLKQPSTPCYGLVDGEDRRIVINEIVMLGIEETSVVNVAGCGHGSRTTSINSLESPLQVNHSTKSRLVDYLEKQIRLVNNKEGFAELDEYWFEPCGYSCNALMPSTTSRVVGSLAGYFTCHISPEPETAYASWELCVPLTDTKHDDHGLGEEEDCIDTSTICYKDLLGSFKPQAVHVLEIYMTPLVENNQADRWKLPKKVVDGLSRGGRSSCELADQILRSDSPYKLFGSVKRSGSWFCITHHEFRKIS